MVNGTAGDYCFLCFSRRLCVVLEGARSKVSNTEGGQTNSKKSSKSETANQAANQARLHKKKNGDHDASQNMPFSAVFLAC